MYCGFEIDIKDELLTLTYGDSNRIKTHKSIPEIKKVVYDIPNGATIVYFDDNTKEIARLTEGDTFDKEVGVLQCIAKKVYGSRGKFLKEVVNKGFVVEEKKSNKKKSDLWDRFLKGDKIAIQCETEKEAKKLMSVLNELGVRWVSGRHVTTNYLAWDTYEDKTCYTVDNFIKRDKGRLSYANRGFFMEEGYEVLKYKDFC